MHTFSDVYFIDTKWFVSFRAFFSDQKPSANVLDLWLFHLNILSDTVKNCYKYIFLY